MLLYFTTEKKLFEIRYYAISPYYITSCFKRCL